MATYGQDTCLFIPQFGSGEEGRRLDWLYDSIVAPVLDACFPKIDLVRELGARSNQVTDESLMHVQSADLVIADVKDGPPEVMFQLGVRHSTGRPIIVMRPPDVQPWLEGPRAETVLYVPFGPTEDTRERLRIAIEKVLSDPEYDGPDAEYLNGLGQNPPGPTTHIGERGELTERIRGIAAAISELRINSAQRARRRAAPHQRRIG